MILRKLRTDWRDDTRAAGAMDRYREQVRDINAELVKRNKAKGEAGPAQTVGLDAIDAQGRMPAVGDSAFGRVLAALRRLGLTVEQQ